MRARPHDWLFGLLAAGICSGAAVLPGTALASDLVEEQHAAERLVVHGFAGKLSIEGADRADIRLELRGSAAALGRLRREVHGDRLELAFETGPGGTTTVADSHNNVVIASNGGRATQIIGGNVTTVGGPAEPPLEVHAYVPEGSPLDLKGIVGELRVAGVDGPVELQQVGGTAELDSLDGGGLTVVGGSRIEAAEARGDLVIKVTGAGDVAVRDAALEQLDVAISGSGNVRVGGSAERARVQVAGVGNVQVDEVRERPDVNVAGVGRVDIGNW